MNPSLSTAIEASKVTISTLITPRHPFIILHIFVTFKNLSLQAYIKTLSVLTHTTLGSRTVGSGFIYLFFLDCTLGGVSCTGPEKRYSKTQNIK